MAIDVKDLKEKIAAYKNGTLPWINLGPYLEEAKDVGIDISPDWGLDRQRVSEIIRGYWFLKNRGMLDKEIKVPARNISYLSTIFGVRAKSANPMTQEEFDKVITDAIEGKISGNELIKMSREPDVKDSPPTHLADVPKGSPASIIIPPSPPMEDIMIDAAIDHMLDALHFMLKRGLHNPGRDGLQKRIGLKCHSLAIALECIADKGFNELQKERKEFIL